MPNVTTNIRLAPAPPGSRLTVTAAGTRPAEEAFRHLAVGIVPADGVTLGWEEATGDFVIQFAQRLPADRRGMRRLAQAVRVVVASEVLDDFERADRQNRQQAERRFSEWLAHRLARHSPVPGAMSAGRTPAEWRFRPAAP